MGKRVVRRPPAKWMYEAATTRGNFEPFYTFIDLAEKFGVSYLSMKRFCTIHKVEGNYMAAENGAIIKLVSFEDFQRKAKEHIENFEKMTNLLHLVHLGTPSQKKVHQTKPLGE